MNQTTMSLMFEEQLETFKGYRGEPRHLCYWKKGFACLEVNHTTEPHPVLMILNQRHYDEGLTPEEWSHLFDKATRAWEEDHK